MIKLLEFLWTGCWHKWVDIRSVLADNESGGIWTRYYTRCSKCGAHKVWDVK